MFTKIYHTDTPLLFQHICIRVVTQASLLTCLPSSFGKCRHIKHTRKTHTVCAKPFSITFLQIRMSKLSQMNTDLCCDRYSTDLRN